MFQILNVDLFSVLVFCIVLLVTYIVWDNFIGQPINIPGPISWPVIQNFHCFLWRDNIVESFLRLQKKYGNLVYLRLVSPSVVVYGYKLTKEILVDNGNKTKFRATNPAIEKMFAKGKGVVLSNGQEWTNLRRFTLIALKDFGVGKKSIEERIHEEVDYLVDLFTKQKENPIDVRKIFQKATSNVISSIIFGSRFDYDDPDFLTILQNVDNVFKSAGTMRLGMVMPILDKLFSSNTFSKMLKSRQDTQRYIQSRIEQQRKTFDQNNIHNFLDLYLAQEGQESQISEHSLMATITDLYFAGTDTTSVTLQWCMLYMLKYPDVQRKCQDEITDVVGNRRPAAKDKEKMPYVQATLHEVQRIATTIPMGVRHCTTEDLHIDGKVIPKGTTMAFCLTSVNMDPDEWEKPETFRPERFIGNDGQFVKQDAFCPFSMGPRICLGKQLAETELFLFFTSFLQHFDLRRANTDDDLPTDGLNPGTTLDPVPFKMRFIQRS